MLMGFSKILTRLIFFPDGGMLFLVGMDCLV